MNANTANTEPSSDAIRPAESGVNPRPIRKSQTPGTAIQWLCLVVSICSAVAAYNAYSSVKSTQVLIESAMQSATKTTDTLKQMQASEYALQVAQERMVRPGRREIVVQVPKGATECRVLVEDEPEGRGYHQNVTCK